MISEMKNLDTGRDVFSHSNVDEVVS